METSVFEQVPHVVNHGTYHHGNITVMLRQGGLCFCTNRLWSLPIFKTIGRYSGVRIAPLKHDTSLSQDPLTIAGPSCDVRKGCLDWKGFY